MLSSHTSFYYCSPFIEYSSSKVMPIKKIQIKVDKFGVERGGLFVQSLGFL